MGMPMLSDGVGVTVAVEVDALEVALNDGGVPVAKAVLRPILLQLHVSSSVGPRVGLVMCAGAFTLWRFGAWFARGGGWEGRRDVCGESRLVSSAAVCGKLTGRVCRPATSGTAAADEVPCGDALEPASRATLADGASSLDDVDGDTEFLISRSL